MKTRVLSVMVLATLCLGLVGCMGTVKETPPPPPFKMMGMPEPGDWLASQKESGQTFEEYVQSRPNRPAKTRNKIVLQPLAPAPSQENLKLMEEFLEAWFSLPVEVRDALPLPDEKKRASRGYGTQYHTSTILRWLETRRPADAICYLGVTIADLYPKEGWNFVFGMASLRERVGVYSLVRFGNKDPVVVLRRTLKILCHESGHMFGLQHCIEYECGMNGYMSKSELDRRPIHLCPVCLRKLQWNTGFDVLGRYQKLHHLYKRFGMEQEASWTTRRLFNLSVRELLEQPKDKEEQFAHPVHYESRMGNLKMVRALWDKGADWPLDNRWPVGVTPLHLAVWNGHYKLAKFLLKEDADPTKTTESGGYTPAHLAAIWGDKKMLKLLRKFKADLSALNEYGETPADLARAFGYKEVAEWLEED